MARKVTKKGLFTGVLLFLTIIASHSARPSGRDLDSLRRIVFLSKEDPRRLSEAYLYLALGYLEYKPDSAASLAECGLRYARQTRHKEGLAGCYLVLGDLALRKDRLAQAKVYLETATHFISRETDPIISLNTWNDLGCVNDIQSSFGEAVKCYYQALDIAEQANIKRWKANLYNNIAVILDLTGSYRKSLGLYRKAGAIFLEIPDSAYYANALINQGYVYLNLKNADSAEVCFNTAMPIERSLMNHYGLANLHLGLAQLKREKGLFGEAKADLDRASEMIAGMSPEDWGARSDMVIDVLLQKGLIALGENKPGISLDLLRQARAEAGKLELLSVETKAIDGLGKAFVLMKRFDSAYHYSTLCRLYGDSLEKKENRQQVAVSEFLFHAELDKINEKARQNALQIAHERRIILMAACSGGILLVAVIMMLLYFLQKSKTHRLQLVRENLALEKLTLEQEILHKNRELTASAMSLIQSGERMEEISNQLVEAVAHDHSHIDDELQQIIRKLKQPETGRFWEEFDRYFVAVHETFYKALSSRYPTLTTGEIRLCALLKLNLATKEIASITKRSEHSIRIARYRLRLKLKLARGENLNTFLNRI